MIRPSLTCHLLPPLLSMNYKPHATCCALKQHKSNNNKHNKRAGQLDNQVVSFSIFIRTTIKLEMSFPDLPSMQPPSRNLKPHATPSHFINLTTKKLSRIFGHSCGEFFNFSICPNFECKLPAPHLPSFANTQDHDLQLQLIRSFCSIISSIYHNEDVL